MSTKPVMDKDEIDNALHEIRQMCLVAYGATDSLVRSDTDPGFFELPAADAEMLCFSISDLLKRVETLKGVLFPSPIKSTVLAIVRD